MRVHYELCRYTALYFAIEQAKLQGTATRTALGSIESVCRGLEYAGAGFGAADEWSRFSTSRKGFGNARGWKQ